MSSILMFSFAFSQDTETEEISPEQIMQQKMDDLSNEINEMKSIFNQENATLQSKIMMLEKANKDLAKELGDNLENQKSQFETNWNNGYSISSGDGMHSLKFGGRLMLDESGWTQDEDKRMKAAGIRRARLYHAGHVYGDIFSYKFDLDFSGASVSFKDMYIELDMKGSKKSWGKVRSGHFKHPFGLESLTSSNYMTFMERSLPNSLFPERGAGTMYHTTCFSDKMSLQLGAFFEGKDEEMAKMDFMSNDAHNITGRLTYLPINKDDKLLHVGASFARRVNLDQTGESLNIEVKPENNFADPLLHYNSEADAMNLMGTEMSLVLGSLSFQAEYMMGNIDEIHHHDGDDGEEHGEDHDISEIGMSGYYAQVSYFLTGEKRPYKSSYSGFGRVSPKKNYLDGKSYGALELAIRYSGMSFDADTDVIDDMTHTGPASLNNFTVGLNWYINPAMRVMFNYVMATKKFDVDEMEDIKENALMSRIQINF